MLFFSALIVAGLAVGVAYLLLVADAFARLRQQYVRVPSTSNGTPAAGLAAVPDERIGWKAAGGVVASTSVLALASVTPYAWYLPPVLAVGSAAAVVVAFLIDRTTHSPERPER
jgi:hypothetical protein